MRDRWEKEQRRLSISSVPGSIQSVLPQCRRAEEAMPCLSLLCSVPRRTTWHGEGKGHSRAQITAGEEAAMVQELDVA